MDAIEKAVTRLRTDAESGELVELCARHGIDLLVLFGSAVDDASTANDVDVAYARVRGEHRAPATHLDIVNALGERYGDHLDVLDLDAAGSVARFEALHGVELLAELTPGRYANAQMAAFGAFVDTQRFRDRVLEVLAH